jgi:hypothetical protein
MIIDQGPQPCAHKGCSCEVPAGQTYCGPHCANASVEAEAVSTASCACGHAGCSAGAMAETQSDIETP